MDLSRRRFLAGAAVAAWGILRPGWWPRAAVAEPVLPAPDLMDGEWHYVNVVVRESGVSYYVDGKRCERPQGLNIDLHAEETNLGGLMRIPAVPSPGTLSFWTRGARQATRLANIGIQRGVG